MKKILNFLRANARLEKDLIKLMEKLNTLSVQIEPLVSSENKVKAFVEIIIILYRFQEKRPLDKSIVALKKKNDESLSELIKNLEGFNNYMKSLDKRHNLSKPGEVMSPSNIYFYCYGLKESDLISCSSILDNEDSLKKEIREIPANGVLSPSQWYFLNNIAASMITEDILEWVDLTIEDIQENLKIAVS